jgi:glutaredoxin 3
MPKITIYTTPICFYCARAKDLLERKGLAFDEIDLFSDESARSEMEKRSNGRHTVPQIFIGGRHVGGCDELYALEDAGQLDPLLEKS